MKLPVGIPLTAPRPAQLSFRPLSIVHHRSAPDRRTQLFDVDVPHDKSDPRSDDQLIKPVREHAAPDQPTKFAREHPRLDHPDAWDTSNVFREGSTFPTDRTAHIVLFISYFKEVMSGSNLAKQKRMLTQATSQLGKVNLVEILENDNAWMTLSKEIRQGLYDLFPAPMDGAEPRNIDINPLHSMFRPYVEDAITAWQDDLREGRETKKWRQDAIEIGKQRELGKFDEYRTTYREEWWGSSDGEDEEGKEAGPLSSLPVCDAPCDTGRPSSSNEQIALPAKAIEKTDEGSEASFRTTTTDANSASMYAAQPPRIIESFRTETTEADTVVDEGEAEEKEMVEGVPKKEEVVPEKEGLVPKK